MPKLPQHVRVVHLDLFGLGRPSNFYQITNSATKEALAYVEFQDGRLVIVRSSRDWKWLHQHFGICREAVEEAIREL